MFRTCHRTKQMTFNLDRDLSKVNSDIWHRCWSYCEHSVFENHKEHHECMTNQRTNQPTNSCDHNISWRRGNDVGYSAFHHVHCTLYWNVIYTVSQNCANLFFVRTLSNLDRLKIFGTIIAGKSFSAVYSFSTSPNLCERTTVLNADAPNCYDNTVNW